MHKTRFFFVGRYLSLFVLSIVSAASFSGCASQTLEDDTSATGSLKIVATTTQVADYTRNIVGDTATITQLIKANQSVHNYEPTPADLTHLKTANVLIINGRGLETWLPNVIEASGFRGITIDTSEDIGIASDPVAGPEAGTGPGLDTGTGTVADTDTVNDIDSSPGTDTVSGNSAGSSPGNPHIWMNVHNAEIQAHNIEKGLIRANPPQAQVYKNNAGVYGDKLNALDEWIRASVNTVPVEKRLFVSNHDAFGHFTTAYNITYVGTVMPNLDDNAEPSVADIENLVANISQTGAKAVFSEASVSPKAAETIARQSGITVYSGNDALYVDSLGVPGTDGDTYIASQLHNTTLLCESWGVTPAPLPQSLQQK